MYKNMAITAREEGFPEIAAQLEGVAGVEAKHEERYKKLAQNIKDSKVFEKDEVVTWKCSNCGHIYEGKSAAKICPVCNHPMAYFELRATNY
jgi:rubrerythrin